MSKIAQSVRRRVLERDGHRCRECGIKVREKSDLPPHFHHRIPKSAGGKTTEGNLITLCGLCHLTKLRHTFRLEGMPTKDYPQLIKWTAREISIDFLAFAERLADSEFPSSPFLLDYLEKAKAALGSVANLIGDCHEAGIGRGELTFPWVSEAEAASEVEEIVKGLKIAWVSHYTQRSLDRLIQQSTRQ